MTVWILLMLVSAQNQIHAGREALPNHRACIKEEARAVTLAKQLKVQIKTKCVEAHRRDEDEQ